MAEESKSDPPLVFVTNRQKKARIYEPPYSGESIDCHGEAHRNGFIDHCMVCMPNWGTIRLRLKVTADVLESALADGKLVPLGLLPDEVKTVLDAWVKSDRAEIVKVRVGRSNTPGGFSREFHAARVRHVHKEASNESK